VPFVANRVRYGRLLHLALELGDLGVEPCDLLFEPRYGGDEPVDRIGTEPAGRIGVNLWPVLLEDVDLDLLDLLALDVLELFDFFELLVLLPLGVLPLLVLEVLPALERQRGVFAEQRPEITEGRTIVNATAGTACGARMNWRSFCWKMCRKRCRVGRPS
jgi:hypothetical protein